MNDVTGPSIVSTLAATLPKAKAKTVGKTLGDVKVEALLNIKATTLLKVVAKAFEDTQTKLQTKLPVKTEANTLAVVQAYAYINTLNKVVGKALAIDLHASTSAGQKRCLHTDTHLEIEFQTRKSRSVGRDTS